MSDSIDIMPFRINLLVAFGSEEYLFRQVHSPDRRAYDEKRFFKILQITGI